MKSGNALIVFLYVAEFHVENYVSTVEGLSEAAVVCHTWCSSHNSA